MDNVYFQHGFNNPSGNWLDLNSKAFEFELGFVWIQVGQGLWSHCIQQHQVEIEFLVEPLWSDKILNSAEEQ